MSHTEFKRLLETNAAESLFALLRTRGHEVANVRWPDREREGKPGQAKGRATIDLTFQQDGAEVAVDIIELHESEMHARQNAEMGRLVGRLERDLSLQLKQLNPHTIAVSWDLSWLPDTKTIRAGLKTVKATLLAAAPTLHPGDSVELEPKPDFISRLVADCWASDTPTFGFMAMHDEQTVWVGQAAESMADSLLVSHKPEQLKGFDDARVLAVDRAWLPLLPELHAALESRRGRIPSNWTAIYFVVSGDEGSIVEVWRR